MWQYLLDFDWIVRIEENVNSGGFRGRRSSPPPPPKKDRQMFFPTFCIRMLKNKAQIERENIKNPESFQGP